MRNNFLGVILFSILLFPSITFAKYDVKGDTNKNINNYEGGSSYAQAGGGYNIASDDDLSKANLSLFNTNEQKTTLTPSELTGLKLKLQKGGSKVDIESLTVDNVYTINTGKETIFVHDPEVEKNNPNDTSDQRMLGLATADSTKDARMYIYKNPPLKESKGGNDSLDTIDRDRGLNPGSTLSRKNQESTLQQERSDAQKTYDEALANKNAAQAELDAYQGSDAARRSQLEQAVRNANLAEQNAGRAAVNAGHSLAQLQQQQANSAIPPDTTSCGTPSVGGLVTNYFNIKCTVALISWLTNIIFKLTSFVAYIAGTLFDYSLELSINSAQFFKKLGVIEVTWSFIRDVLNMTFIFILLWTAVQILIGNDAKYNAKQVLTRVIIVAILMNFSLFAAKLMVDGSNIVSLKIYEAMKSNTDAGNTNATISERIMNTVGLSTLYNISDVFTETNTKVTGNCANNPGALITISVMGSIFLIILTLALGLAAILFLVRLVNIIVLFIKSPLWVWGYVLPGHQWVTKQKDDWWSEMKHVLTFPIAYLFWMLVAVIIFDSLGGVKNDPSATGGLLGLICNTPTAGAPGAGAAISLVAIFCIVIIFMMKAIEYGVKHAAGGPNAIGNNFATSMSKRFAGYQNAMTQGLAKKAGSGALAVGGMSVGAARGSLKFAADKGVRVGAGVVQGTLGKKKFTEGFGDGFSNPGINAKEAFRDMARKVTASTAGGTLDKLGVTSLAAKLAEKYKDPTNKAGETRKQADARRTKGAVEDETRRNAVIEEQHKILTEKEWKKKNATGTMDDYAEYVGKKIEARTNVIYGKGIASTGAANGSTHLENLKKASLVRYEEAKRDSDGKIMRDSTGKIITEQKIRFDEYAMRGSMQKMAKEDKVKEILKSKKTKFTTFQHIKAEARMKALEAHEKTQRITAHRKTDDEERTRKFENDIPDLKETISKMPSAEDVKAQAEARTLITIPADGYDGKALRDVNTAIAKYKTESNKPRGVRNQEEIDKLADIIKTKHQAYAEHIKKTKSDLANKETAYIEHLAKLDEKK